MTDRKEGNGASSYLRLADEDWVMQALETMPAFRHRTGVAARDLASLVDSGSGPTAPFAVSRVDESGGNALSSLFSLESVHWPPLVVLARSPLTVGRVEALRRQGCSALLSVGDDAGRSRRVLDALARSPQWFSADLRRAPLADLLQMWNSDRRSGLVWVGCPHVPSFSMHPWWTAGSACTRDPATCQGWAVRLWLQEGQLVFAESPTHRGIEALSQCLSLEEGSVRVHEVYIKPRSHNLHGTMPQLLIGAAALADERAKPSPAARVANGPLPITTEDFRPEPPVLDFELINADDEDITTELPPPSSVFVPSSTPPPLPHGRVPAPNRDPAAIETLLNVTADVQLAIEMDDAGTVVRSAGEGDAESTAAVATLCRTAFSAAGESLGLGPLSAWCVVGDQTALYTQHQPGRSCSALASASDHGFRILGQLFEPMGS